MFDLNLQCETNKITQTHTISLSNYSYFILNFKFNKNKSLFQKNQQNIDKSSKRVKNLDVKFTLTFFEAEDD